MFSSQDLRKMIIPLFFEQLLGLMVGLMDTLVISFVGEAAVSGVSLVNQFNTMFIFLFTALASGGAVVISQYIGGRDKGNSVRASSQLLMFSVLFSAAASVIVLIGNQGILTVLFGRVDDDVMEVCTIYLRISAYSYPALAVYSSGAALYRSLGKTKVTMYISVVSNVVNVIGNFIGVFVLHAGAAGVAYPSLLARVFSAAAITILCFNAENETHYAREWVMRMDRELLKKILGIAVPNGIENAVFQLVKIGLSSVVALFGTYQIAANGIAQSFWSIAAIMSLAMQPVYTTVIGQCMGARDIEGANSYFRKLNKLTLLLSVGWNGLILAAAPFLLQFYALSSETRHLVVILVLIHNLFNGVMFPFFGPLGFGLRAAGDVRFTMIVAIASTIFGRLLFSLIFALGFGWGVIGIALAMGLDWTIRAVLYYGRLKSRKWEAFRVI